MERARGVAPRLGIRCDHRRRQHVAERNLGDDGLSAGHEWRFAERRRGLRLVGRHGQLEEVRAIATAEPGPGLRKLGGPQARFGNVPRNFGGPRSLHFPIAENPPSMRIAPRTWKPPLRTPSGDRGSRIAASGMPTISGFCPAA